MLARQRLAPSGPWLTSHHLTPFPTHNNTCTEAALLVERLQEELLAARPKERRPTLRYIAR